MRKFIHPFTIYRPPLTFSFDQIGVEKNQWSDLKVHHNECFVFVLGFGKYNRFVVEEVGDTVITAYKILSKKFFYFESRGELLKRLFSIAGKKVQKISMSYEDVAVSLGIICISSRNWWVGLTDSKIRGVIVNNAGTLKNVAVEIPETNPLIVSGLLSDTKGLLLHTNVVSFQKIQTLYTQINKSFDKTISQLLLAQTSQFDHNSVLGVKL